MFSRAYSLLDCWKSYGISETKVLEAPYFQELNGYEQGSFSGPRRRY